jgi:hypothetical protein
VVVEAPVDIMVTASTEDLVVADMAADPLIMLQVPVDQELQVKAMVVHKVLEMILGVPEVEVEVPVVLVLAAQEVQDLQVQLQEHQLHMPQVETAMLVAGQHPADQILEPVAAELDILLIMVDQEVQVLLFFLFQLHHIPE